MRISDWSSDVCSSDLRGWGGCLRPPYPERQPEAGAVLMFIKQPWKAPPGATTAYEVRYHRGRKPFSSLSEAQAFAKRSEEHTSELQSLMRISYAVFCLKKKKDTQLVKYTHNNTHHYHY